MNKFEEMYNGSWFTVIGAGGDIEEWKTGIQEMLDEQNIGKIKSFEVFKGKEMNKEYNLVGNNAFQDDVTFLAFPLDGLNIGKLAMFKLRFGARWFDDIVNNSIEKEND